MTGIGEMTGKGSGGSATGSGSSIMGAAATTTTGGRGFGLPGRNILISRTGCSLTTASTTETPTGETVGGIGFSAGAGISGIITGGTSSSTVSTGSSLTAGIISGASGRATLATGSFIIWGGNSITTFDVGRLERTLNISRIQALRECASSLRIFLAGPRTVWAYAITPVRTDGPVSSFPSEAGKAAAGNKTRQQKRKSGFSFMEL